jgi:polysaccharide export outer membrane protein
MKTPIVALLALACLAGISGCQEVPQLASPRPEQPAAIVLREGDVIRISFPGAPSLDAPPQPIRRDGKITVGIVGEMPAAGLTPAELQTKLLDKLSDQIQSKEVLVTVVSSNFEIYVDGQVLHPGKILVDHPITAMEAIMESGGFNYGQADTTKVRVLRHNGQSVEYTYYVLNLQQVLEGKSKDLFYLEPGDMVHVQQKFSWF